MAAPQTAQKASPGDILLVIHEFAARSPDEITLHKGDRVELIERDDDFNDGWYLGRHIPTNHTGLFPEVYTILAPQATLASRTPPVAVAPATQEQSTSAADDNLRPGPQPTPFGSRQPSETTEGEPSPMSENSGTHTPVVPPAGQDSSSSTRRVPTAGRDSNQSSTVMTETLSVIDEHITDLHKPVRSRSPFARRETHDTTSEYSANHSESRLSYIQGSESEAEEEAAPTEKQVMQWSPHRVAEYLEDNGVERRHCDVFIEQELSGEVILAMDQATLFMKELDLGPIGRRLKTWQRIKALQDAVKNSSTPTGSAKDSPRGNRMSSQQYPLSHSPRPSAASVRSLGHARRQSSIDQAISESPSDITPNSAHAQHGSLDKGWTMINSTSRASSSAQQQQRPFSTAHGSSLSADTVQGDKFIFAHSATTSQLSLATPGPSSTGDDRGYISSVDADAKQRRVLQKKHSSGHDRTASHESGRRRLSFFGKKSSRPQSPARGVDAANGPAESPVIGMDGTSRQMDGHRVVSEPGMDLVSPTRYEDTQVPSSQSPETGRERSATVTSAGRKGLRAISDAITGKERSFFKPSVDTSIPTTASQSPRSSTPSGASKSLDFEDANQSQYSTSTTGPVVPPRRKDKKQTSAYLRGLEKKSPQEQMVGCDYSGWMKKKSSNLMTNWKPRLFVLRGRRLSYYYSDTDTEEKGLIDISGHRVLSADNERLTGLHASLTGATASPTSPSLTSGSAFNSPTIANGESAGVSPITPSSTTNSTPKDGGPGFIFKLVPPRSGMSRAVNFTKPTVHYFAVPSVEEGRLWMAALMKATIDRDDTVDVVTTYQQKTISLAKARARKERPPALKNLDEEDDQAAAGGAESQNVAPESAGGYETAPSISGTTATDETKPSRENAQTESQIVEVTDLETPASPSGLTSLRMSKRMSSTRRTTSHGSATGLGIEGLSENGLESPIKDRMNNAGLW
ncbi:hypothetical protein FH972_025234 [Carpinus fangiana]|uniref:SAM domain-containing protein n=1 Tax=Carpinus fangiana TaxID=176857 RepID=A0A5N6L1E2_9ROSI|nr:hypothetical protein FH972_025234 [Carpinus fangiana]